MLKQQKESRLFGITFRISQYCSFSILTQDSFRQLVLLGLTLFPFLFLQTEI